MGATSKTASSDTDWRAPLADVLGRLPAYIKLSWALARASELPRRRKLGLYGGVLYSLLPVDLVPGFVPVLGQLDDLAILLQGIRSALRRCPPELASRLLQQSGLAEEQIDQDLQSLGKVAKDFSRTVATGAWRGGRAVGKAVSHTLASGARALWGAYRPGRRRP